jgi:hypothetical protein
MKLSVNIIVEFGLVCFLSLTEANVNAALEVSGTAQIGSVADFNAPLAACGTWTTAGSYGSCWHPAGVPVGWRPYCDGQWIWTDCGWYWQSDEPWAWACYHYGTWTCDPIIGWIWVPGVEWAPAWVSWRYGGGYVGWAPCPPAGSTIDPAFFAFVEMGRFNEPIRPRSLVLNNAAVLSQARAVKNPRQETRTFDSATRKVVVNEGPGAETIQRATGKDLRAEPIQQVAQRTTVPSGFRPTPTQTPAPARGPAHSSPVASPPDPGTPRGAGASVPGVKERHLQNAVPRQVEPITPPSVHPAPAPPTVRPVVPPLPNPPGQPLMQQPIAPAGRTTNDVFGGQAPTPHPGPHPNPPGRAP